MLICFDGTDAELYDSSGDSNVVRFMDRYMELTGDLAGRSIDYQAGPGTRLSVLGFVLGGAAGVGWRSRVRESLNFACHTVEKRPNEPVDGVGFSRGVTMLDRFAREFHRRSGRKMRCFIGFDMVDSILLDVMLRCLPKKVWYPPKTSRIPAEHVFHVTGPDPPGVFKGGKPSARWFIPTRIEGAQTYTVEGNHSVRGRSDESLEAAWNFFINVLSLREDRRDP
jgi:hypothetical protein